MEKVPLSGIKIVEFADMVSGPYCGKLLADLGAEVVKVELPGGDPARAFGPFPGGSPHLEKSGLFLYNNTSKRGVVLDLAQEEGRQAFSRLVSWADALIDNHPPETLEGFGVGWENLRRLNPNLVYTIVTPYGLSGPRAKTQGDELTVTHAGGLGNVLPSRSVDVDRPPVKLGGFQAAYHGGIAAALATLAVLFGRRGPGDGRRVEISLQEVVLALVSPLVTINRYHDLTWSRVPDRPPAMGRMQTSDGYVVLGAADDHPTHGSAGDADLMNGMSTTFAILAALHHRRQTGEGQFIDYSQCEGVSALIGEAFLEYQMTGQVPERKGNTHPYHAPLLGEHNDYVLREILGLCAGEVEELRKQEIILPRGQEGRHLEH